MNDLPRQFSFAQISMYTDEAKLYAAIPYESAARAFQYDIEKLQAWCSKSRLKLNAAKCHHIHYNPRSLRGQRSPTYHINGDAIEQTEKVKDLDIFITDNFKFHK